MYARFVYFLLILTILTACSERREHQLTPAFYHWKTKVSINGFEQKYLNLSEKIYIKFFDIDLVEGKIQPKATIDFKYIPKQQIIPTVFITNRTLYQLSVLDVDTLSERIALKIKGIALRNQIKYDEIQLDCDWTQQTKSKYFRLLRQIKKSFSNKILSATIRLHQVKYPELTGVPPIDRGMLMCYNMDDWKKIETENSIFNAKVLEKYAQKIPEYPLPLDLALPLFNWSILYRNEKFIGFFNHLDIAKINSLSFIKNKKENMFEVQKDTSFTGVSLRVGDIFKTESVDFETIQKSSKYVLDRIKNKDLTLAFYHLDSITLQKFNHEQLQNVFTQTP